MAPVRRSSTLTRWSEHAAGALSLCSALSLQRALFAALSLSATRSCCLLRGGSEGPQRGGSEEGVRRADAAEQWMEWRSERCGAQQRGPQQRGGEPMEARSGGRACDNRARRRDQRVETRPEERVETRGARRDERSAATLEGRKDTVDAETMGAVVGVGSHDLCGVAGWDAKAVKRAQSLPAALARP